MTWFICDQCGDTIKKPSLAKHFYQCHGQAFTCIDCSVTFDRKTVSAHSTCVTEHQKYALGATKPGGFAAQGFVAQAQKPVNTEPTALEFLSTRPPWKCSVCNVSCTSKDTLMSHAAGVKHKRRAKAASAAANGSAADATPEAAAQKPPVPANKSAAEKRPPPSDSSSSSSSDDSSDEENGKAPTKTKPKKAKKSADTSSSSDDDEQEKPTASKQSAPAGKTTNPSTPSSSSSESSSSDDSSDEEGHTARTAPVASASGAARVKATEPVPLSSDDTSESEEETAAAPVVHAAAAAAVAAARAGSSSSDASGSSSEDDDVEQEQKRVPTTSAAKQQPDSVKLRNGHGTGAAVDEKGKGGMPGTAEGASGELALGDEGRMAALSKLLTKRLAKKGVVGPKVLRRLAAKQLSLQEEQLTNIVLKKLRNKLESSGVCQVEGKKLVPR